MVLGLRRDRHAFHMRTSLVRLDFLLFSEVLQPKTSSAIAPLGRRHWCKCYAVVQTRWKKSMDSAHMLGNWQQDIWKWKILFCLYELGRWIHMNNELQLWRASRRIWGISVSNGGRNCGCGIAQPKSEQFRTWFFTTNNCGWKLGLFVIVPPSIWPNGPPCMSWTVATISRVSEHQIYLFQPSNL